MMYSLSHYLSGLKSLEPSKRPKFLNLFREEKGKGFLTHVFECIENFLY